MFQLRASLLSKIPHEADNTHVDQTQFHNILNDEDLQCKAPAFERENQT